jgi:molecular chaperone GrpE
MGKVNVRPEARSEAEKSALDPEHELAAGSGYVDDSPETRESSGAESEVQKLRAERDSLLDRLSRAQAEFENARRRASKEQQDFREYATADAIKSLLPVVDSLERAVQVKADPAELRGGIELIYKQLQAALSKLSVTPIVSKGESFDPRFHEAIEMVETNDAPDHQVVEELQRGYKFKDRLLRPAMVKVAKNPGR